VEGILHTCELRRLLLFQLGERDTGPAGHDELDVLLLDRLCPLALVLLPLALELLLAVPEDLLLLAERRGLLEFLGLEVHVLLTDDPLELLLDLLELGGGRQRHQARARGGLVDNVDRLVG